MVLPRPGTVSTTRAIRAPSARGAMVASDHLPSTVFHSEFRVPHSAFEQAGHQRCGGVSKTLSAGGSTQTACQWGRGRQVMHLPCKQAQAGALPAALHPSL